MRLKLLLFLALIIGSFGAQSQEYLQMIDAGTYTVQEIIDNAEAYFADKDKGKGSGYKQFKRWEYNAIRMVKENGYLPTSEERLAELERYNAYLNETANERQVLNDNWEELGPTSWNATTAWSPGVGRITAIAFDPADIDHIIVGGETGGVWRTIDGGQNWEPLNDYFTNLYVYSVAMDPSNTNTYFFGSTNGRVFKSTDSGATWSLHGTMGNSIVNKILINPSNTNIMFGTAENAGIYKSLNGGVTWTQAVSGDNRGYDIEFKPGNLSVMYASGNGFHKSIDGGNTFTTISGMGNGPKMIGVSPDDSSIVYVIQANNGMFGGYFTSSNSGDSFTLLNHGGLNFFGYSTTGNDNSGQAPRDMDIAVNPSNVDEVHIAGVLTWRSTNGGVSFSITSDWIPDNAAAANIGYCHADVDILEFYGSTLFVGTDGGIFKAENTANVNANYYEDITDGLGIRQFYKIGVSQTADVIVSGGSQDNGTSFYEEANGWIDWIGADGMETFIDKANTDFMYGTSQLGQMYRTVNGGVTLFSINEPGSGSGNWVTPFEQDPTVNNAIYVGYNIIYKSLNSGASWSPISQNFGSNLNNLKIAPSNNQVMYASRSALLYKTEDGGATAWLPTTNPGGLINSIAIHPTNPLKIAVAVTAANRVFVSEDGGTTWIDYKKNLPNFSSLAVVWDNNGKDGLYLGMDYGLFYIDNTLTDWQPYNNLLPNVIINELEINNATDMLYAGTYGRGLWASPLVESILSAEDNFFESNLSIYPNPANSEITISLKESMEAEIRVFDITGKLLIFENDVLIANTFSMDVSSLPSGVYFIRLNTESGTVTKKLLKK